MSEQSLLFQLLASVVTILVGFALTLGGLRLLDRFGVLHQFLPRRTVYLKKMVYTRDPPYTRWPAGCPILPLSEKTVN